MILSVRKIDCVGLGILSLLLLLLFLNGTSVVSCWFNSSRHSLQNGQDNNILSQHFLTLLSFFCHVLSGRYCQIVLVNTVYRNALPPSVPPMMKWDWSFFLSEMYKATFCNIQISRCWRCTLETNFIVLKGKMGLYSKLQSFFFCFFFWGTLSLLWVLTPPQNHLCFKTGLLIFTFCSSKNGGTMSTCWPVADSAFPVSSSTALILIVKSSNWDAFSSPQKFGD